MKRTLAILAVAVTGFGAYGVGTGAAALQIRDHDGGGMGMILDRSHDGTGLDARGGAPLDLHDGSGPNGPWAGGE